LILLIGLHMVFIHVLHDVVLPTSHSAGTTDNASGLPENDEEFGTAVAFEMHLYISFRRRNLLNQSLLRIAESLYYIISLNGHRHGMQLEHVMAHTVCIYSPSFTR
jgi:hypothetical protein